MRFTFRTAARVAATGLALACTTPSKEVATPMDPACEKACDEAYQVCDEACTDAVDDDMCEPECIATLRSCTDECR